MRGYTCAACRSELTAENTVSIVRCPYCGGGELIETGNGGEQKPDSIVPFRVSREEALALYRKYTGKLPLLPSGFTKNAHGKDIQGVYAPLRLSSGKAEGRLLCKAGDVEKAQDRGTKERFLNLFEVLRVGEQSFRELPVYESRNLPGNLLACLEPFSCGSRVPFAPEILAGFPAELAETDDPTPAELKDEGIRKVFRSNMINTIPHQGVEISEEDIHLRETTSEQVLFPLWLLPTECDNKVYLFAVNGESGDVYFDYPVSTTKQWGIVAGVLVAVLVVLYLVMRNWLYAGSIAVLAAVMCSQALIIRMRPVRKRRQSSRYMTEDPVLSVEEERLIQRQSSGR